MYTANNQVIIEDLYDDNTQPPDEDIIEYAEYIGINTKEVNSKTSRNNQPDQQKYLIYN